MAGIDPLTLFALIGSKAVGDVLHVAGTQKNNKEALDQRNREMLQRIAMRNKEMDMQNEQFRQKLRLEEEAKKKNAPSDLMKMLSQLGSLGRKPVGTADVLSGLFPS